MKKHRIARRWRKSFWRWHRRVGLVCFIFLSILALTGVLLNHADGWKLYAKPLPTPLARTLYGNLYAQEAYLYDFDGVEIYQIDQSLYLGTEGLTLEMNCVSNITGVARVQNLLWSSCGEDLALFEIDGRLIEKIRLTGGEIGSIARCETGLCLRQESEWFAFDEVSLTLSELPGGSAISEVHPRLAEQLPGAISHQPVELNFGRLIADIHSGAIIGIPGRLLMDLIGLAILFLSISGCYLWLGNKPR